MMRLGVTAASGVRASEAGQLSPVPQQHVRRVGTQAQSCTGHHIMTSSCSTSHPLCCCVAGPAGAGEAVCRLLPLCLLHHSPEVRRAAVTASRAVVAAESSLVGPLLAGLRHLANNTQEALVLVVSATWSAGALRRCPG
jgi:hypothetical protein